eukprot:gene25187-10824_t
MKSHGVDKLKKELMTEFTSLYAPEEEGLPEVLGQYEYFTRPCADLGGPVAYVRRPLGPTDESVLNDGQLKGTKCGTQVVMDAEVVAKDVELIRRRTGMPLGHDVSNIKLSRGEGRLAYTIPLLTGPDRFCAVVKDLSTGQILEDGLIPNVAGIEFADDGQILEDGLIPTVAGIEFADDGGHTLMYTVANDSGRPWKVMVQAVSGPSCGKTVTVLEEPEEQYYMEISRTKDWSFLVINSNSKISSQVHLLPASSPFSPPKCVQPRLEGLEYFVEHQHPSLYILTNYAGCNAAQGGGGGGGGGGGAGGGGGSQGGGYGLVSLDLRSPSWGCEYWRTVEPTWSEKEEKVPVAITDMDMFNGKLILFGRQSNGAPSVSLLQLPTAASHGQANADVEQPSQPIPSQAVPLPSQANADVEASQPVPNHPQEPAQPPSSAPHMHTPSPPSPATAPAAPDHPPPMSLSPSSGKTQALHTEALLVPATLVHLPPWALSLSSGMNQDFNARTLRFTCSSPTHPPSDFDFEFESGALYCISTEAVPGLSLEALSRYTSRRTHATESSWRSSPLLLLSYGAYGQPLDPVFDSNLISLLDRGYVVAYLHVRGGGELGRAWHEAGRKLNKHVSVQDYLHCIKHLVEVEGYSSPGLVVGHATSADLITAMTDPEMPLTVHEYGEWGNPAEAQVLQHMANLCPYYNLLRVPGAADGGDAGSSAAGGGGGGGGSDAGSRAADGGGVGDADSIAGDGGGGHGLEDVRVPFWAPAKWAARARMRQGPVVLRIREGGHQGSAEEQFEDLAEDYAFMIQMLQDRGT